LGFESHEYTPLGRGFDSYYGYLGGGEDYFDHKSGGYIDLHDNNISVFDQNGSYSAVLFANKSIEVIEAHPVVGMEKTPLFLYLAFQSIHSPIQAPQEWVQPYEWIEAKNRRTMAGMASCMDAEIRRV
jgi:arylsulfatase B